MSIEWNRPFLCKDIDQCVLRFNVRMLSSNTWGFLYLNSVALIYLVDITYRYGMQKVFWLIAQFVFHQSISSNLINTWIASMLKDRTQFWKFKEKLTHTRSDVCIPTLTNCTSIQLLVGTGFMTDCNEDIPYKTACFNILGYPSWQRKAGKIQRGIPADKWTTGCHGNTGDRTSDWGSHRVTICVSWSPVCWLAGQEACVGHV